MGYKILTDSTTIPNLTARQHNISQQCSYLNTNNKVGKLLK